MYWLLALPTTALVLLMYNVLVLRSGNPAATLAREVIRASLASGAIFTLTTGELLVLAGVIALFIEIVKATRTSTASVVDHALSTLVFAAYLVEFLMVQVAGTGIFMILTIMSLLDLIAGFSVTLGAARRDLIIER
jgi:hypothetical protein